MLSSAGGGWTPYWVRCIRVVRVNVHSGRQKVDSYVTISIMLGVIKSKACQSSIQWYTVLGWALPQKSLSYFARSYCFEAFLLWYRHIWGRGICIGLHINRESQWVCGTLTEVLSRTRLISSCIAVVMVGPRPAGLLAHRPASGLTVRGLLCGVGSTWQIFSDGV